MKKRPAKSHEDKLGVHEHQFTFFRWFEWFTDLIIPYLLVALGIELILENPFWTLYSLEYLEPFITYLDYFIAFFFIVDLSFKWVHVRNVVKFVKLYWLDILAVLPFYTAFRVYARFAAIAAAGEEVAEAQKIAHEIVLAREAELLKEAELLAREEKILKDARPLARILRSMERGLRMIVGRNEVSATGMRHAILKHENK
ncbi:MAG TPA: hypothetical protein VLJ21_01745 [Candidatus Binatia bacterium]|nr:hypothetical protein [Candidatus Binatia bacterium]